MRTSRLKPSDEHVIFGERISDEGANWQYSLEIEKIGLLYIPGKRTNVIEMNYSNNCLVNPARIIEEKGLDSILNLAVDIDLSENPFMICEKIERWENGYPLVFFRNNNGNIDYSNFSLLHFGKKFDLENGVKLGISYKGMPVIMSYEEAIKLNNEVSKRLDEEFSCIKNYLISAQENRRRMRNQNKRKK